MSQAVRIAVVALAGLAAVARGQARDSSAFADVRADGNGIDALRTTIGVGFAGQTAGEALKTIASLARLNLTFDPRLPGMTTRLEIAAHQRSVAVALIEVGQVSHLRIRVARDGQLVVDVAGVPEQRARIADSATRAPVSLPAVRTEADRREREAFTAKTNLGGVSITGQELRATPSFVEPDLLRSVQLLPGIVARSDYTAGFNSRGGESDQNLILLDGYPIYSPYHLGGVFSTFIDPTVGRVDLRTGGLPVRYGGRLSSVLDVQSAEPVSRDLSGTVEVSLVSSTASVGRTFGDDGSWMIAARRTYADAVVNLVKPNGFPYHFRDFQGHVAGSIGGGMRLSITAYDGVDRTVGTSRNDFAGTWGNGVAGATLTKTIGSPGRVAGLSLGDSIALEARASLTRFDAGITVPDELFFADNRVADRRLSGSITSFSGTTTRSLGYELAVQRLTYRATASSGSLGDLLPLDSLDQRMRTISVYADQVWRPRASLLVEMGARVDAPTSHESPIVSPRLSLKYFWRPNIAFTVGGGSYAQWTHSLGREEEPVQPIQFWVGSDSVLPVSRARDVIVGMERWVTNSRLFHLATFYKRYDHVLIPNPQNAPDRAGDEFFASDGTSYGVDLLLRQLSGGAFSGWMAYTYAVNSRIGVNGISYWPTQDRRHNLNLVGSWRKGAWVLGTRLNVASGMPYTPVLGGYIREQYDPVTRRWLPDSRSPDEQNIPAGMNADRLPWYERLDVSANYAGHIRGASVAPYLSVINVFNSKNPAAYLFSYGSYGKNRASFPNLPFAPTFGVHIAF